MFPKNCIIISMVVALFVAQDGFCSSVEQDWNDFLHYTAIGRFDLAEGYGQKLIESNPDPKEIFRLSRQNPAGYQILLKMHQANEQLGEISGRVLVLINEGRLALAADARVIIADIERLSGTIRGQLEAEQNLRKSGQYAVPYMLDALADPERKEEFANITIALGKMDADAIRPLAAALQMDNVAVKAEIIRALGKIGYPQSLAYLKFVAEKDPSSQLGELAAKSIEQIDPTAAKLPAAELFFALAESYYNHNQSLAPAEEYDFANMWFWDKQQNRLVRLEVAKEYFNELMTMRCCEWALKADETIGKAIGLWLAAFFRAEETKIPQPEYFGAGHMEAASYAATAGPEYLHQALERALKDKNAYVALAVVESLAINAGEKSLLYQLGTEQPLVKALGFDDIKVKYSAAIAIGQAGPGSEFVGSSLIIRNLASALRQEGFSEDEKQLAESYALRAINVMLHLAVRDNKVVNLADALETLVEVVKGDNPQIQVLSGQVLAYLASPDAQRAIADTALNETNDRDVRLSAFASLVTSAKLNANMLTDSQLDALYAIVSSFEADPDLRSAAAGAYGALNLPSRRVKDLIIEQSRS